MNEAELIWISNEYEIGDFGMGGAFIKRGGYVTPQRSLPNQSLQNTA